MKIENILKHSGPRAMSIILYDDIMAMRANLYYYTFIFLSVCTKHAFDTIYLITIVYLLFQNKNRKKGKTHTQEQPHFTYILDY